VLLREDERANNDVSTVFDDVMADLLSCCVQVRLTARVSIFLAREVAMVMVWRWIDG